MEDRVQPIRVTDKETGTVYELDFNRESIRFAEARHFDVDDVQKYPHTKIQEFFYYSLRKNHKSLSKEQADKLLQKLGGLPTAAVTRLVDLYNQAGLTNIIMTSEEAEKNEKAGWEL